MERYDLIPKLEYSEAVNLLTLLGKFIDIDYMFELDKSLQESIRLIYKNNLSSFSSAESPTERSCNRNCTIGCCTKEEIKHRKERSLRNQKEQPRKERKQERLEVTC